MKTQIIFLLCFINWFFIHAQNSKIELENYENEMSVEILGDAGNQNGMIKLFGPGETNGVLLDGNEIVSGGGEIILYDQNGNEKILLDAANSLNVPFIQIKQPDNSIAFDLFSKAGSSTGLVGPRMRFFNLNNEKGVEIRSQEGESNGGSIVIYNINGEQTIELDAEYGGKGRIFTQELEITGGSDFAENFDISNSSNVIPKPGMLVSIDPDATGKLMLTQDPFDTKIAGVISGANGIESGIFMGQKGSVADGEYPIALSGRVYVYATTENGPIIPGDSLTSSSKTGYAMKVICDDPIQGAVVGKAMSRLKKENGFVLVLINLQ